jgi:hypothetical protein
VQGVFIPWLQWILSAMKNCGIPIAAEGWPFIIPLSIVTGLLFAFG